MGHFNEAILRCPNVKIDVARLAQRIVLPESRECHDFATIGPGGLGAIQNIRRLSRRAESNQYVASAPMPLDLTGKDIFIAEIVAKARQHGAVAESHRPYFAALGEVDSHMGRDAQAASFADEHRLFAPP